MKSSLSNALANVQTMLNWVDNKGKKIKEIRVSPAVFNNLFTNTYPYNPALNEPKPGTFMLYSHPCSIVPTLDGVEIILEQT